ncbi:MAG: TRAP transporter substrate-binding protein [Sphaerochaetaceae bacterium]|nr:TRAP transporter substrate-binding protein [Sphaerochaetaceae bacterium]
MKKLVVVALVMLTVMTMVFANGSNEAAASDKVYTIKLGHTMNENHPRHQALLKFKEYVEANTNGKVKVELYPNAVLGSEADMQESMRMGTLEAFVGGPFDTISKKLNLFLMPFFFEDQEALMRAAKNEQVLKIISDDAEANGLKVLAIGDGGARQITNSKRRLTQPSDLQGLKLRTPSIEAIMVCMKALGANTVSIPLADCYMALKTGVADGQENPIATIYDQKLHEVQKYICYVNYQYHPEVLTMNAAYYNSLPAEYQKVLSDAAWLFVETKNKLDQDSADAKLEEMKAYGCDVYTPTAEEKQAFIDACAPVYDHFVNELKYFSQEELDLVRSLSQGK